MIANLFTAELTSHLQLFGTICQAGTAVIAAMIGVIAYRDTKRQSALSLINQDNGLANLVTSTIIQSEAARATLGKRFGLRRPGRTRDRIATAMITSPYLAEPSEPRGVCRTHAHPCATRSCFLEPDTAVTVAAQ